MKLIKIQYKKLEESMPIARKPAKISNYKFMCVMLYIIENCIDIITIEKFMIKNNT